MKFCEDCKNMINDECHKTIEVATPMKMETRRLTYEQANKNNDCEYFESNIVEKLTKGMKKRDK